MKTKLPLLLILFVFGLKYTAIGADTTKVFAHEKTLINWYGEYYKWVKFPSAKSYRKINLIYTLQCPKPNNCTDYDYTQQIFLKAKGGKKDSIPVNMELTRLINPFGIDIKPTTNLIYRVDVSDYASLLQDSLYIGCLVLKKVYTF